MFLIFEKLFIDQWVQEYVNLETVAAHAVNSFVVPAIRALWPKKIVHGAFYIFQVHLC